MWRVMHSAENDPNRGGCQYSPREANLFWLWKPFEWWIPSRSPGGTWQTWASSLSLVARVSIPCRSPDRIEQCWRWGRNIRPGTLVAEHPGISQTTTAHSLRVHPGVGSLRPGLEAPCRCPALHPRLAWQDPTSLPRSGLQLFGFCVFFLSGKGWGTLTVITMDRSAIIGKRRTVTSWSLFFDVHRAVPQGTEGYSVLHLRVKLLRRQCKHELSLERAGLASSPPSHPVETQTLEFTCSVMHCLGGAYYGYAKRTNDYRVGRHHGTLLIQSSS